MGEWMNSYTHSRPRHYLDVSGEFHAPASLPPEKESRVRIG
jgi:hypothetical protein